MIFLRILSLILITLTISAQRADRVDSFVTLKMKENHIPGFAFAVIKNNQVIRKGVYGISNVELGTPVHEHTVFKIASMTKQFTCAAILLLEQDKKLSQNDKLSKYIDNLPAEWKDITLYQLMNHTAGLKDDWDEQTSYFLANHTVHKMLLAQQKQQLLFKPGEGHHYSSGPFFLGLVIEKVTGEHYSSFLQERIFSPLNMTCTSVYSDSLVVPSRASGYWWKNNRIQHGVDLPPPAEGRADVGIISCLEDLIKWIIALKNNPFLDPAHKQMMFTPGKLNNGRSIPYGLGWYIYPLRSKVIYGHGGTFRPGFNSRIMLFPGEETELVFLCNLWRSGLTAISERLAEFFIPGFEIVRERSIAGYDPALTKSFNQLFQKLNKQLIGENELYKQVNISGFDTNELAGLLKGFRSLEIIHVHDLKSNTLKLFDKEISQIYFYKLLADKPGIWSFHLTKEKELVSVNLEE